MDGTLLLTVKGKTDGANTTGDFSLVSDLFHSSVTAIRIPKGLKAKIWCKRISGAPVTVKTNYTKNVAAPSPVWVEVGSERLASDGELTLEKRRPIILSAATGLEGFKFSWEQATAAVSNFEAEIELGEE